MATSRELITTDQARNSAFDSALHGSSNNSQGGLRAMMSKDNAARTVAMGEYFQHWDNKKAEDETDAIRQARTADYASLTRQ
jgi:sterol 24-C-methyltransferase